MPSIKIVSTKVHATANAGRDGSLAASPLVEAKLKNIKIDVPRDLNNNIESSPIKTPEVTLEEDFLEQFKILKPVLSAENLDGLPKPEDVLKVSPKRRLMRHFCE